MRPRASALSRYGQILRDPRLKALFPGLTLSYVGDGMSMVAIPWLALTLAPPGEAGWWVGLAIAAYTLPGAFGVLALTRLVRRMPTVRIAESAALLRAVALGVVTVLGLLGALSPVLYVALLAASSLLYTWGISAQYTLVAEILSAERRLSANALFYSLSNLGAVVGAALAGILADTAGPVVSIGADAASFAILAATYRLALARHGVGASTPTPRTTMAGVRAIHQSPVLFGMLAVTFLYYVLAGPIQAALPLFVADELGSSSRLLGTLWSVSSAAVIIGALLFGLVRAPRLWPTVALVIMASSGMSLLLGSATTVAMCLAGFTLSRIAFSPYPALSFTLIQSHSAPGTLAEVLAVRGALVLVAPPLGSAVGGLLVDEFGPRISILLSASSTLILGAAIAAALVIRWLAGRHRDEGPAGRRRDESIAALSPAPTPEVPGR